MVAVEDLQWGFNARFAQIPVVLPGVVRQCPHQLRDVDVIIVVEMTEPPCDFERRRRRKKKRYHHQHAQSVHEIIEKKGDENPLSSGPDSLLNQVKAEGKKNVQLDKFIKIAVTIDVNVASLFRDQQDPEAT